MVHILVSFAGWRAESMTSYQVREDKKKKSQIPFPKLSTKNWAIDPVIVPIRIRQAEGCGRTDFQKSVKN